MSLLRVAPVFFSDDVSRGRFNKIFTRPDKESPILAATLSAPDVGLERDCHLNSSQIVQRARIQLPFIGKHISFEAKRIPCVQNRFFTYEIRGAGTETTFASDQPY